MEAGRVERWQVSSAAWNIESSIASERLAQLNACIPSAGDEGLRIAMHTTALFGLEVCDAITEKYGWTWPKAVGEETCKVLRQRKVYRAI